MQFLRILQSDLNNISNKNHLNNSCLAVNVMVPLRELHVDEK